MKLLIILCSHEFNIKWYENIKILNTILSKDLQIDYCGISNQDDFHHYESILQFKYKIINTKRQFSKICDFITEYKSQLDYDWYMKIRPDILLLEPINFNLLSTTAINARARVYHGPSCIKYGMSVGGEGCWKHIKDNYYSKHEHDIILDDMLFIFHHNVIQMNAFNKIKPETPTREEWKQTTIFNNRSIPLHVIGIHMINTKYNVYSGDINMNKTVNSKTINSKTNKICLTNIIYNK
jgi:hypothetical protein